MSTVQQSLRCITEYRYMLRTRHRLSVNVPYSVSLNQMDPVRLAGSSPIMLVVGQIIRVVSEQPGQFRATTVQYSYRVLDLDAREILAFHWTPEGASQGLITTPHVHVGPALLSDDLPIRSGDFHRVHVPTERVSIEAIVRLAITEFGVTPLLPDWAEILDSNEAEFQRSRRR